MKKDEMETQIHALQDELDDAQKEIAWLRQSIYGSEKVAKLEEEIEGLKEQLAISEQAVGVSEWRRKECLRLEALNADLTQDINTLKSRLLKAVDKVADLDGELESLTTRDMP